MTRKFRLFGLTLVTLTFAGLYLPADAAAQQRGGSPSHGSAGSPSRGGGSGGGSHPSGGGGGGGGGGTAVPRPGYGGGGYRPGYPYRGYYGGSYYYRPYYYPGFYNPFFWGCCGYGIGYGYGFGFGFGYGYGYGYGYPYAPYYYYGAYDITGSAKLEVTPKNAEVFVDGYYVGKVGDFDGTFERLKVDAGPHELAIYLEGFTTIREKVLFRREGTLNFRAVMQPLAAGATSDRPVPDPSAVPQGSMQAGDPQDASGAGERPDNRMPPPPRSRGDRGSRDFGTLAIRVQPGDAEILIDGERWDGSDNGSRLSVQLAEGPHRVEVHKDGFRAYTANVRVTAGQTESLNVSLSQQ